MGIRKRFQYYIDRYLSSEEKNLYLDDIFLQHICELPLKELHVSNICEAIINAQTNGRISLRGLRKPKKFKHQPLQGLFEVHCEIVTPRQIAQNFFDREHFIFDESGQLQITEEGWNIIEKAGGIETYCKKRFEYLDEKAKKRTKTGFWLIYGKYEGVNHYLYLDLEYSHEQDRNQKIYKRLVSLYSHEKIEMLKSGK